MPIIPEYSFAEGRHAPSTASPDMAALPALANAKYIAPAIMEMGEAVVGIAASYLKSEEARADLELGNQWAQQEDELKEKLAAEPDPARRRSLVGTYLAKGNESLKGVQAPEGARGRLEAKAAQRGERVKLEADAAGLRLSQERGRAAMKEQLQRARQSKDVGAATQALDLAVQGRFIPAEASPGLLENFHADLERDGVKEMIRDHPQDAAGWIASPEFVKNFRRIPAEERDLFQRMAQAGKHEHRAGVWKDLTASALENKVMNRGELNMLRNDGVLSDAQVAAYAGRWHAQEPVTFNAAVYNELFGEIGTYRQALDPTRAGAAQLRERITLAPLPGESLKQLHELMSARVNPEAKPPHRLAAEFQKFTQERFDSGAFSNRFWKYQPAGTAPPPITGEEWAKAHERRLRFTDAWDAYLRNAPDDLSPVEAQKVYEEFYGKMVSDMDVAPLPIPRQDDGEAADEKLRRLLGLPASEKRKALVPAVAPVVFGGRPVQAPGMYYRGGRALVGEGATAGAAVPREVLEASFPGKDEAWFLRNVKVAVQAADGRRALLPLSSTAGRGGGGKRPGLDLTPAALEVLGGSVAVDSAGAASPEAIGEISFALTTDNAGAEVDMATLSFEEVSDLWFADKRPVSPDQIVSGLRAVQAAWLEARHARQQAETAADEAAR
jgi:hypothetical protein